jgi:hypothetical protein
MRCLLLMVIPRRRFAAALASALANACADTHAGDVIGADPAPDAGDSSGFGNGGKGGKGGGGNAGNSHKPDPPNATLDGKPPPACDHVRATAPEVYCQHASCMDGENGRCTRQGNTDLCSYDECFASGDCRTGGPCDCATYDEAPNHCMAGNCKYDQDCADGLRCSPSYGFCGPPLDGYYCHTPDDLCSSDDDCELGDSCIYEPAASHWLCMNVTCFD